MLEANGSARGKLLRGWRFCDSGSLAGVLSEGNLPLVGLVARALGSWNTMSGSGQAAVHSSVVCAPRKRLGQGGKELQLCPKPGPLDGSVQGWEDTLLQFPEVP